MALPYVWRLVELKLVLKMNSSDDVKLKISGIVKIKRRICRGSGETEDLVHEDHATTSKIAAVLIMPLIIVLSHCFDLSTRAPCQHPTLTVIGFMMKSRACPHGLGLKSIFPTIYQKLLPSKLLL